MRICFIATGEFRHTGAYLDFFKRGGHDVHFVALTPGPERGVRTHNVEVFGRHFNSKWKFRYVLSMIRARFVVRKLKPDIVHAHFATSAGLAAYICGVHPYIVTAHGSDVTLAVRSAIWRMIFRRIFRNADCVNPVSDELRDMVLGLGIPSEKVETLSLGIDSNLFMPPSTNDMWRPTPLRLICTRDFKECYDHSTIIHAMSIVARKQIEFKVTFAGDGPLGEHLRALAANLGIRDKIEFKGTVAHSRLPALLAEHNTYLSAATRDGTSLCLLEAMASGLYPIVSDIKANADWITHGRNGLLHKVSEPQSLADCILALRRDSGQAREAPRYNRKLVVTKGDRTTNMKRLEEVYFALSGNARSQGPLPVDTGAGPT